MLPTRTTFSDDLLEALMHSIIRDLRTAMQDLHNYTVRSNLMWDAALAGKRPGPNGQAVQLCLPQDGLPAGNLLPRL